MRLGLRVAIVGSVALAAGLVLWLKPRADTAPSRPPPAPTAAQPGSQTTVLLFADASEAESSCGCGEIIRMVRSLKRRRGDINVREVSPTEETASAREHAVRVSPTVIISRAGERAPARFEGESPEVIAALRAALTGIEGARPRRGSAAR